MKCPIDGNDLVISDRQGVEIDYCPQCRGVWLDRGELDKIIERMNVAPAYDARPPQAPSQPRYDDREYRQKRKKSFFEELFD